jgi:hypothetical protein
VPAALSARLGRALADAASGTPHARRAEPADALLDAAVHALGDVLNALPMTRAHALDVLAADALATYAFEAAAESGSLPACADDALVRIAALGEEPG